MANPLDPDRRLLLGMPGYGQITGGAARGFWLATRLPINQVTYAYNEGSLLAANFNALWVQALNLAHSGKRLDYFAMQHADIEPEGYWLDDLIAEMEARGLDVLGVVAPIKDPHGLTSIALARPDGDNWRPLSRLTMAEVFRLPPTFTSEDAGYPILLNTGLWVCRFDLEWARKVSFTINDRIAFDTVKNRYVAQCEPEDWYFSRLLHELGLKIGCTRKIRLAHRGGASYRNDCVWGKPFDDAWVSESPLAPDPDGFTMPEINGWLTFQEGAELARLAKGKRVLEIGSYFGLSTVCLARTAGEVVSIDTHDGRGTEIPQNTFPAFETNLRRYDVDHKVRWTVGTVDDAHELGDFDLVFIDGGHDAESVGRDIAFALRSLAPNGLIAFHDYKSADPDVTQAVDALLGNGATLVSLTESLAVVSPPVPILQES
jgi:hypothetical protein